MKTCYFCTTIPISGCTCIKRSLCAKHHRYYSKIFQSKERKTMKGFINFFLFRKWFKTWNFDSFGFWSKDYSNQLELIAQHVKQVEKIPIETFSCTIIRSVVDQTSRTIVTLDQLYRIIIWEYSESFKLNKVKEFTFSRQTQRNLYLYQFYLIYSKKQGFIAYQRDFEFELLYYQGKVVSYKRLYNIYPFSNVKLSKDEDFLVFGEKLKVRIFSSQTLLLVREIICMMSEVLIEISTDNKIYTISRHNEKELKVFALNSSDYYKGITIDYCKTECFTVSQNNSMIASAYSNKKIIIHLLPDMIDYFILQSHEAQIEMLLFTSDFSQLISGGVDSYLLVWSLSSRALFKKINLKIGGYQLEPLNCNHLLISGYDNDLRIINIEDGNSQSLLDNHHDEVTVIALSKSLSFLATGGHDYNIFIWNIHDLSFLRISNAHDGCIRCLNFTQNEDYLLSQGGDCLIKMWKRANMELVRYFECQMNFEQIFVGRDDSMLVAYKEFSNIKIWDLGKGKTYELLNSDGLGYIYSITKNKMYMVFIKINLYIVCKFSYIEN